MNHAVLFLTGSSQPELSLIIEILLVDSAVAIVAARGGEIEIIA